MNWKEKQNTNLLIQSFKSILGILQNTYYLWYFIDNEAYFLFRDLVYANGDPYFETYLDSIWDLYVLVTTANSPDVM